MFYDISKERNSFFFNSKQSKQTSWTPRWVPAQMFLRRYSMQVKKIRYKHCSVPHVNNMNTRYMIHILGSCCRPGKGPYSSHPLQNCRALVSLGNTQPPSSLIRQGVAWQGFSPYKAALQFGLDSPLIRWKISFSKPIDTKLAASDRNIWCNRLPSWIRTSFSCIENISYAGWYNLT